MMMRWISLAGVIAMVEAGLAQEKPHAELEVQRVALFSSGVGYFEAETQVDGSATAELSFRTEQINDILKSLVVQDFGKGHISVVSYASQDPIEKTLKSFGVDITGDPTLAELLDQLRGEPVEITGPRTLTGVILGVEKQRVIIDNQVVERDMLNLLTEEGMKQIPIAEIGGIKLLNDKVAAELRRALETLARAHDADKKSVLLHFDGEGQRTVRAAYLLEAPIWKTSYRLVIQADGNPFLQGWAMVENATEEDWNDVRLSLISGRPISFRMDLYTPIYIPRPIVQLDLYASLRPPEYAAGFDEEASQIAERMYARRPSLAEEGRGGAFEVRDPLVAKAAPPPPAEPGLALEGAGVESVAAAQEAGELFEYTIRTPVTIPRQRSAMLPIVNQEIEGRKVSIYNPGTHEKYPLNGLELTNSTDLHLMQGPVTVFEDEVYAGDAKLPDLKPGEERLIGYALDLAVELLTKQKSTPEQLLSMRVAKGVLYLRHKYVDRREYLIKNKAEREKTLLLEQPYSDDWTLVKPAEAYERTQNLLRFEVALPPGETIEFPVELERVGDQTVALVNLDVERIKFYLRMRTLTPEIRQALERLVELRARLDDLRTQREDLERQVQTAVEEQARIRENLRTLPQNTDSYKRQLEKFDELETRIGTLREQIEQAREDEQRQRNELNEYLLNLNIG